jgi:hypothetical protein
MPQVFISHVEEEGRLAAVIALALEAAGLSVWHYQRDSLPGLSYLRQIGTAIEGCEVLIVIVSNDALGSKQMTTEIVRGFELGKPLVPLLWGVSHADFQKLQPEWRGAFGAATSIMIPLEGVEAIIPRLISGLAQLGVVPKGGGKPVATPVMPPAAPVKPAASVAPGGPVPASRVDLTATFDRTSYPDGDDSLAYCLAELRVVVGREVVNEGPGADIALVLDVSGSMDKPNRYPLLRHAVRRFALGLGPKDRVSVILFTDKAKTVIPFMPGDEASEKPDLLIDAMDESGMLFGPKTFLAPGLWFALNGFGSPSQSRGRVRRTYVLTDGELHDPAECEDVLVNFRPQVVEVHVYGFGDEFDAGALKRLVSDQIGGTVKPILNESDIVRTFAHVAEVNRRLIGQDGSIRVVLAPAVACGDAWVFQPTARYLGPIRGHRLEHFFGGIEAGRRYSLLLELRLPKGSGPIATLEAGWIEKGAFTSHQAEILVPRGAPVRLVPEVRRALDILHALRAKNDQEALLASQRARRELAVLENRDPNLIAALDRMIAALTKAAAGNDVETSEMPTPLDQLYIESDTSSILSIHPLVFEVRDQLMQIDMDLTSGEDALRTAIIIIGSYVRRMAITLAMAENFLREYTQTHDKVGKAFEQANLKNPFHSYIAND